MPKRSSMVAGLLLVSFMAVPVARADTSPQDRAAADALYDEAGKLAKANRWAEACAKLEASLKLDPAIGALLRLGYCYEQIGRTASAWSTYHDASAMALKANDKRVKDAEAEAKRLEPALARLLVDVAPENRGVGMEIRLDGAVIAAGAWGTAVPVDPGSHAIEASQPAKQTWKTTVQVEPKPGVMTVRIPALVSAPEPEKKSPSSGGWSTQRTVGLAVAGGGALIGAAVGTAFGVITLNKTSESASHCSMGSPKQCDPTGLGLRNDAKTTAKVADVALALGGAAVIAGVVVFFTAPAADAKASSALWMEVGPALAGDTRGFVVRGGW